MLSSLRRWKAPRAGFFSHERCLSCTKSCEQHKCSTAQLSLHLHTSTHAHGWGQARLVCLDITARDTNHLIVCHAKKVGHIRREKAKALVRACAALGHDGVRPWQLAALGGALHWCETARRQATRLA